METNLSDAKSPLLSSETSIKSHAYNRASDNLDSDGFHDKPTTLEEAHELIGHGWAQYRIGIVCGLCFMSDSIEIGMLSFLQIKAADEFDLTSAQESVLTSMVFAGELVGALLCGPLADKYGRFKVSLWIALFLAIVGVISAFSVNYEMLVVLRALVGVAIGGLSVPFDILAEFVQPKYRGRMLMFVEYFWSIGTIVAAGIAWAMLEQWGWRWFVGLCSIPVCLALLGFTILPESPHWLLNQGREREALLVLQRCAEINGKPHALATVTRLVLGTTDENNVKTKPRWSGAAFTTTEENENYLMIGEDEHTEKQARIIVDGPERVSPLRVFEKGTRGTMFIMCSVWVLFGFTYYGVVLILPEVLGQDTGKDGSFNYEAMFTSSLAEVVACTIAIILIDKIGRRYLAGISYILCGCFAAMLAHPIFPKEMNVGLTMVTRGFVFIASSTTWVMTPELFPTYVRGSAHSWCNGVARLGAAVTPFWGNAKELSQVLRLGLYGGTAIVAGIMTFLVRETRGKALR